MPILFVSLDSLAKKKKKIVSAIYTYKIETFQAPTNFHISTIFIKRKKHKTKKNIIKVF